MSYCSEITTSISGANFLCLPYLNYIRTTLTSRFCLRVILILTISSFFWDVSYSQKNIKDSIEVLHKQVKEEAYTDPPSALQKAETALLLSKANMLKREELQSYYCFGIIYYYKSFYNLSNDYYRKITQSKDSDTKQLSAAWNNMGINFEMLGQVDSALYCYQESRKLDNSLGDEQSEHMVLINMGLLNHKLLRHEKAVEQTREALDYFLKTGDRENLALCYLNLGLFYSEAEKYDSSEVYYKLAETIYEKDQDNINLSQVNLNLGVMYTAQKNKVLARERMSKSKAILTRFPNSQMLSSWNSVYAGYHKEFGSIDSAIYYSLKALQGFDSLDMVTSKKDEYFYLASYYAEKGDMVKYRDMMGSYDSTSKWLEKEDLHKSLAEMEVRYKLDMNNLKVLNTEKLLDEKKTQVVVISIFSLALFAALLFTYRLYVRVKQANKNLYEKNVELAQQGNTRNIPTAENRPIPETNDLLMRFEKLLSESKLYKKPELNLKMAAQELGTNEKYLSQAINMGEYNFNTLINRFRVNEARQIILDGEHNQTSVEEIGLMVGFTNRHTFSRAFTQVTGISPSEFRKIHLSQR